MHYINTFTFRPDIWAAVERGTVGSIPGRGKTSSLIRTAQTCSETYPASSYSRGTDDPLLVSKAAGT